MPQASRDFRRAGSVFLGDDRIWILPWIDRPFRWTTSIEIPTRGSRGGSSRGSVRYKFQEVAIQGEGFDRIDILHIDSDGRVFAPSRYAPAVPGLQGVRLKLGPCCDQGSRAPRSVYLKWLAAPPPARVLSDGSAEFVVPILTQHKVGWQNWLLRQSPGPIEPIKTDAVDAEPDTVWPPPGSRLPPSVSREAESEEFYGDLRFDDENPGIVLTAKDPKMRALHVNFKWAPPFDELFPYGGGADLRAEHNSMKQVVEAGRATAADIRLKVAPYRSETATTIAKAWFWPRLCADGEANVLVDLFTKYRLDFREANCALIDPEFVELAGKELLAQRLWGWAGYFWFELLTDVELGLKSIYCQQCGKPVLAKKNKRFCNPDDNAECYRARRAAARRRER